MKEIPLTQGKVAIIDDEDYGKVAKFKWYAHKDRNTFYARTNVQIGNKRITLRIHNVILGSLPTQLVDHRNHDGLDNRRENIRSCTRLDNSHNIQNCKGGSSRFKGVCWTEGNKKWRSHICLNGKKTYLGYFVDEEAAAHAYDAKALELFGEFACLNFELRG